MKKFVLQCFFKMNLLIIFLFLVFAGCSGYHLKYNLFPPEEIGQYTQKEVEVKGNSMMPIVRPGTKLFILENYYDNHEVQRYDIIAYKYAGNPWPLMKAVYAIPGDHWQIKEKNGAYRIIVNGKILRNSEGKEYRISKAASKRLELYSQSYPVIHKNDYLILGNLSGGSLDSSDFGLVNKTDFSGRIVFPPQN